MKQKGSKSKGDLTRFEHDRRILLAQTRNLVKMSATDLLIYWKKFPKLRLVRYYQYGKLREQDMRIVEALHSNNHFGNIDLDFFGRDSKYELNDYVKIFKGTHNSPYLYNYKKSRSGTIIRIVFYDRQYYYHVQDQLGNVHGVTVKNIVKL